MRLANSLTIGIILLSFAMAIFYYPQIPENMPSHWNATGSVNGYMPKLLGLLLFPLISVSLFLLFVIIPKIDPMKYNIEKFRKYFDGFVVLIMLFLLYVYSLVIGYSLGAQFNMTQMLSPAFALLFFYIGILIEKAEPNWTIGIRTPWTLNNKIVWKKTHAIGGKLFKIIGILALLGMIAPEYTIFIILIPIIITIFYLFAYSYFEYQKIMKPVSKNKPRSRQRNKSRTKRR